MNLSQLRYFAKLAELQHVTKAAAELYITQPSLTGAIHSLEHELGTKLFERQGRNIRLTESGTEFNKYVRRALAALDNGIEAMREHSQGISGKIRLGCLYSIAGDYLPSLLEAFQERYGDALEFELRQSFTKQLLQELRENNLDAAFVAKPQDTAGLNFYPAVAHTLVAVVSKEHPLASRRSVILPELQGQRIFSYRSDVPIGQEVGEALRAAELRVDRGFDDEITLAGAIALDHRDTVGICTDTIGLRPFDNIVRLPIEGLRKDFHWIYLALRDDPDLLGILSTFREFVIDYAQA